MESKQTSIRVFPLNEFNYPKFRNKIIDLYLHAFTTGEYAQHIAPEKAEIGMDELLRKGSGNIAFVNGALAGVLIAFTLEKDPDFPVGECSGIHPEKTIYIAETMVHADFRGKGIASRMIENVCRQATENGCSGAAIRVWELNQPALSLYTKLGFQPLATITQSKFRSEKEKFEMKKVYLWKQLGNP